MTKPPTWFSNFIQKSVSLVALTAFLGSGVLAPSYAFAADQVEPPKNQIAKVSPENAKGIRRILQQVGAATRVVKGACERYLIDPVSNNVISPAIKMVNSASWYYLDHIDPKIPSLLRPTAYLFPIKPFTLTFTNPAKREFVLWQMPFKLGWYVTLTSITFSRWLFGKDVFVMDWFDNAWQSWSGYHGANIFRQAVALDDSFQPISNSKMERYWKRFLQLSTNVWLSGLSYSMMKMGPEKFNQLVTGQFTGPAAENAFNAAFAFHHFMLWPWFSQFVNTFIATPVLFKNFPTTHFLNSQLWTEKPLQEIVQHEQKRIDDAEKRIPELQAEIAENKRKIKAAKKTRSNYFEGEMYDESVREIGEVIEQTKKTVSALEIKLAELKKSIAADRARLLALKGQKEKRKERRSIRKKAEMAASQRKLTESLFIKGSKRLAELNKLDQEIFENSLNHSNEEPSISLRNYVRVKKLANDDRGAMIQSLKGVPKEARVNIWWAYKLRNGVKSPLPPSVQNLVGKAVPQGIQSKLAEAFTQQVPDGKPVPSSRKVAYDYFKKNVGTAFAITMTAAYFGFYWYMMGDGGNDALAAGEGQAGQLLQYFRELMGATPGGAEALNQMSPAELQTTQQAIVDQATQIKEGFESTGMTINDVADMNVVDMGASNTQ